jgi:hypothetical protein
VVRNAQARQGMNFEIRYKKHLQPFINNNNNSKFAHYLLEKDHTFGKMVDIIEIMHFTAEGMCMDTMENVCT